MGTIAVHEFITLDNPDRIRDLKERVDGGIYVSGSGTLVRAILADGLVGRFRLFVFPLAVGTGGRLFGEGNGTAKFALAACERYDSGVVHLSYKAKD